MTLAFTLSMPNVASWNGQWSGDGKRYVIVKTFRGRKETENAEKILRKSYYRYSWTDGWTAGVTVHQVSSAQSRTLRRQSDGFCGYDWMVKSIIEKGEIRAETVEKCVEAG